VKSTRKTAEQPVSSVRIYRAADDQRRRAQRAENQLALRNTTWVEGVCPSCGGTPELAAYPELNLLSVTFQHDLDCPVAELLDTRES
jgi:hypothetical protein